jgi:hypothetical protein
MSGGRTEATAGEATITVTPPKIEAVVLTEAEMRSGIDLTISAVGSSTAVKMIGHLSHSLMPCPATTVLGIRDTTYQAVVKSPVTLKRIVTARPTRPST